MGKIKVTKVKSTIEKDERQKKNNDRSWVK